MICYLLVTSDNEIRAYDDLYKAMMIGDMGSLEWKVYKADLDLIASSDKFWENNNELHN